MKIPPFCSEVSLWNTWSLKITLLIFSASGQLSLSMNQMHQSPEKIGHQVENSIHQDQKFHNRSSPLQDTASIFEDPLVDPFRWLLLGNFQYSVRPQQLIMNFSRRSESADLQLVS